MEDNYKTNHISDKIQSWLITIIIIFSALSGIVLALICIYSLPDESVQPMVGSIFFVGSTLIIWGLLFYRYKREQQNIIQNSKRVEFDQDQIVFAEGVSDKIIKLFVALLAILFVTWSFSSALICIYALPDKTVQPVAGAVYFSCGAVVLSTFIIVVWKNWISKKA